MVSENWVKESTKRQFETGKGDDYGYLWWCPNIGFKATGLGEQVIEVIPMYNSVIVSTNGLNSGQVFDFDLFHSAIKLINLTQNTEGYDTLKKLERWNDSLLYLNLRIIILWCPQRCSKYLESNIIFKKVIC